MAEFEKGVISEESLDEIAGGINVDKEKLKKGLKFAGIAIVGASALAGLGIGGKKAYDKHNKNTDLAMDDFCIIDGLDLATGSKCPKPESSYTSSESPF